MHRSVTQQREREKDQKGREQGDESLDEGKVSLTTVSRSPRKKSWEVYDLSDVTT